MRLTLAFVTLLVLLTLQIDSGDAKPKPKAKAKAKADPYLRGRSSYNHKSSYNHGSSYKRGQQSSYNQGYSYKKGQQSSYNHGGSYKKGQQSSYNSGGLYKKGKQSSYDNGGYYISGQQSSYKNGGLYKKGQQSSYDNSGSYKKDSDLQYEIQITFDGGVKLNHGSIIDLTASTWISLLPEAQQIVLKTNDRADQGSKSLNHEYIFRSDGHNGYLNQYKVTVDAWDRLLKGEEITLPNIGKNGADVITLQSIYKKTEKNGFWQHLKIDGQYMIGASFSYKVTKNPDLVLTEDPFPLDDGPGQTDIGTYNPSNTGVDGLEPDDGKYKPDNGDIGPNTSYDGGDGIEPIYVINFDGGVKLPHGGRIDLTASTWISLLPVNQQIVLKTNDRADQGSKNLNHEYIFRSDGHIGYLNEYKVTVDAWDRLLKGEEVTLPNIGKHDVITLHSIYKKTEKNGFWQHLQIDGQYMIGPGFSYEVTKVPKHLLPAVDPVPLDDGPGPIPDIDIGTYDPSNTGVDGLEPDDGKYKPDNGDIGPHTSYDGGEGVEPTYVTDFDGVIEIKKLNSRIDLTNSNWIKKLSKYSNNKVTIAITSGGKTFTIHSNEGTVTLNGHEISTGVWDKLLKGLPVELTGNDPVKMQSKFNPSQPNGFLSHLVVNGVHLFGQDHFIQVIVQMSPKTLILTPGETCAPKPGYVRVTAFTGEIPLPGGGLLDLKQPDWVTMVKPGMKISISSNGKIYTITGNGKRVLINGFKIYTRDWEAILAGKRLKVFKASNPSTGIHIVSHFNQNEENSFFANLKFGSTYVFGSSYYVKIFISSTRVIKNELQTSHNLAHNVNWWSQNYDSSSFFGKNVFNSISGLFNNVFDRRKSIAIKNSKFHSGSGKGFYSKFSKGGNKSYGSKSYGKKSYGSKSYGSKSYGKSYGSKSYGSKSYGKKSYGGYKNRSIHKKHKKH